MALSAVAAKVIVAHYLHAAYAPFFVANSHSPPLLSLVENDTTRWKSELQSVRELVELEPDSKCTAKPTPPTTTVSTNLIIFSL